MQEITIERTQHPKQKPTDQTRLGFGNYYTDHMFLMNYEMCIRDRKGGARHAKA